MVCFVSVLCLGLALGPGQPLDKESFLRLKAEARVTSSARTQLLSALTADQPKAFDLAVLLAAEEHADSTTSMDAIISDVDARMEALTESASVRLRLDALMGTESDPRAIATAVSTTLFGSSAPDDSSAVAYFAGTGDLSYYDPKNSFMDCVLERRTGIPITLSLVFNDVCERLGLPMVGLNAPSHLLVAPADSSLPFVVDPFNGGRLLDLDEAADLVTRNAGSPIAMADGTVIDDRVESGRLLVNSLRRWPMTGHGWCARMLRNLRAIHASENDIVRTMATAERLRMVGQALPAASSADEQRDCAAQIAFCIWTLRWEERREEGRALLEDLAQASQGVAGAQQREKFATELLDDAWFQA